MKVKFRVLESRAQIRFALDRDSVCASDDFETHKVSVETYSFIGPVALAEELSSGYLPRVAADEHWWECILNGIVIAKVFSNGKAEKVDDVRYAAENSVYFKYHSARF